MDSKKLSILVIILVVVGSLAYLTQQPSSTPASGLSAGDKIMPVFDANAVARFEVSGPEGTTRLKREDGRWLVESLYGYPADFSKLASQIRGLQDLKAGQVVRNGQNYLDEFGLDEASASWLTLSDESGTELAKLGLGQEREGGMNERYVKTPDAEVALVDGEINRLPTKGQEWIDTTLLNVSSDQLTRITVAHDKNSYTLNIGSNTSYSVEGMKEKKEEIDSNTAGRLARALQYMNFTEVLDPATSDEALGFDAPTTYTATAKNGVTYTLRVGNGQESGTPVRVQVTHEGDTPPENLKELQAHASWTYLISSYSAEGLILGRNDVVKKKEKKKDK